MHAQKNAEILKTENLPENNEMNLDNEKELSPQPEILENGENNNREKVSI